MLLRGILLQTFLVIVASFFLAPVESQEVSVYPPNVTAQSGEQNVLLGCNVTDLPANNFIEWIYFPAWEPTGITIYTTLNGQNTDPNNFTVYHTTLGNDTQSVDLVINTTKPELAAQYLCDLSPAPGFGKTINVIVLDPMECPTYGAIQYNVGTEADISCSVNYYDSTLTFAPDIMWYSDGQPFPGVQVISENSTRKTARLKKNVTLADDDKKFVCIVDFVDSNPDYTDNCTTVFHVMHSVSEISFYPPSSADALAEVAVGDVIKCIANGRPAPMIEWYDNNGTLLSEWSELVVTETMYSWEQPITLYCRANNTIDYGTHVTSAYVESNYTFNVIDAEPNVTSAGTGESVTEKRVKGRVKVWPKHFNQFSLFTHVDSLQGVE